MPVPDNDTLSGLLVALVAIASLADFVAENAGVNVTLMAQDAPGFSVAGQLFVCANQEA